MKNEPNSDLVLSTFICFTIEIKKLGRRYLNKVAVDQNKGNETAFTRKHPEK